MYHTVCLVLVALICCASAEYTADISFLLKNITECEEGKLVVDVSSGVTHIKLAGDDLVMLDVDSSTTPLQELIGLMSRANNLLSKNSKEPKLYVLKRIIGPGMVVSVSNGSVTFFEKDFSKAEEGLDDKSIQCVRVTGNSLRLDSNLAPRYSDPYKMTPLMWAAILGDKATAKRLVDRGADVGEAGALGVTPLLCAIFAGQDEILDYMILHNKPDLNASLNEDGMTLLHSAVYRGKLNCARVLLRHGADPTPRENKWGQTPLHIGVKNNYTEIVNALISARAGLDAKDNQGNTPLHFAAMGGYLEAMNALLVAGADVNSRDLQGLTPLGKVVFYYYIDEEQLIKVVKRLLQESNIKVNIRRNDNRSVLTIANMKGLFRVAQLLKEHGAVE